MIAKAKSISHGNNDLSYITGESLTKKHPEKIFFVKNNFLDMSLDATGIYEAMNFVCTANNPNMKNKVIRMELCPQEKYTKDFSLEDWGKLWDDYIHEFDNIEIRDSQTGKIISHKTNLANSMGTVWLHLESRGGIPHLHGAYCRVDIHGNINNDHNIHLRAIQAAERVALKKGWETARQVQDDNILEARNTCIEILHSMDKWSWQLYAERLRIKGYKLNTRTDSKNKIVGYSLLKGNSIYHASKLGVRGLTAAHIEQTWRKMHPQNITEHQPINSMKSEISASTFQRPATPTVDYTSYHHGYIPQTISFEGTNQKVYLPEKVNKFFDDEFDYRFISNSAELCNMAIVAFAQLYLCAQSEPSYCGGGTTSDMPWRDEDEDDIRWARRCALYAEHKLGIKNKNRYKR